MENQLIRKSYYEAYMEENEKIHPVRVLGAIYMAEQQKELPDLSYIRFAQGEVYFHNKDYETAIFKWENISNELEPWAKKNVADAYFELDCLSTAEGIYKSVKSDNDILNTEVSLRLFWLYSEENKYDAAVKMIKKAVSLKPDYSNVTELARAFFEDHQDWGNAIELAVNEALRTESPLWYDILKAYAEEGRTNTVEPGYFTQVLTELYRLDPTRFEQLAVSLWIGYKGTDFYFSWLKEMHRILAGTEASRSGDWHDLSALFKDTYLELISGKIKLKSLEGIIPLLLTSWIKVTDSAQELAAAAAVLSWNEMFPSSLSAIAMQEAEFLIGRAQSYTHADEKALQLFDSLTGWAKDHNLQVANRLEWIIREVANLTTHHLLIAGTQGSGKSSLINSILGNGLSEEASSAVRVFKDNQEASVIQITDVEIREITEPAELKAAADRNPSGSLFEFGLAAPFLKENKLTVMDTPELDGTYFTRNELFRYTGFADSLLYVVDANKPITGREMDLLSQVHKQSPELRIHILLTNLDSISGEIAAAQLIDDTSEKVNEVFPGAEVFAFSARYESSQQLEDLSQFISLYTQDRVIETERIRKLLFFIRKSIHYLLDKRTEIESGLTESIKWDEDITSKLNGAVHQLEDLQHEKVRSIKKSYSAMKEIIRDELKSQIPELLKGSAETISEDSDFGKIDQELNDDMNTRIKSHIQTAVLPRVYTEMNNWIGFSRGEFNESQAYLDEMAEGFNTLFEEERLRLKCDFKVLEDWSRDADRMTSGYQMEPVNILLRFNPSHFLLKSAGKLLGAIPQNKSMLYNRYKQFVENEDFNEVAEKITNKFMQQFELFENSLERDLVLFFREPFHNLNETIQEVKEDMKTSQDSLALMKSNPEVYRDPLKLFEVRLHQYEWMSEADKAPRVKANNL